MPALGKNPWNIFPQSRPNSAQFLKISIFSRYLKGRPSHGEVDGGDVVGAICCTPDGQQKVQISAATVS